MRSCRTHWTSKKKRAWLFGELLLLIFRVALPCSHQWELSTSRNPANWRQRNVRLPRFRRIGWKHGFFSPHTSRNSSANMKYTLLQTPVFEGLDHKINLRGFAQREAIFLGEKSSFPTKHLGFCVCFTYNLGIHFLSKNHYLEVETDKSKNRSHSNPICIIY